MAVAGPAARPTEIQRDRATSPPSLRSSRAASPGVPNTNTTQQPSGLSHINSTVGWGDPCAHTRAPHGSTHSRQDDLGYNVLGNRIVHWALTQLQLQPGVLLTVAGPQPGHHAFSGAGIRSVRVGRATFRAQLGQKHFCQAVLDGSGRIEEHPPRSRSTRAGSMPGPPPGWKWGSKECTLMWMHPPAPTASSTAWHSARRHGRCQRAKRASRDAASRPTLPGMGMPPDTGAITPGSVSRRLRSTTSRLHTPRKTGSPRDAPSASAKWAAPRSQPMWLERWAALMPRSTPGGTAQPACSQLTMTWGPTQSSRPDQGRLSNKQSAS